MFHIRGEGAPLYTQVFPFQEGDVFSWGFQCTVVINSFCTGRGPVGLVSFPGSGNTWVRGLLQQATGICTGKK